MLFFTHVDAATSCCTPHVSYMLSFFSPSSLFITPMHLQCMSSLAPRSHGFEILHPVCHCPADWLSVRTRRLSGVTWEETCEPAAITDPLRHHRVTPGATWPAHNNRPILAADCSPTFPHYTTPRIQHSDNLHDAQQRMV